jgi:hypothetical protein
MNAGGACGYQTAVGKRPFNSIIAAGSSPLYRGGEGCGACYEVSMQGSLVDACGRTRPVYSDNVVRS